MNKYRVTQFMDGAYHQHRNRSVFSCVYSSLFFVLFPYFRLAHLFFLTVQHAADTPT